jgi:hypothetical protein
MELGRSLTLIRPRNTKFVAKRKSAADLAEEKEAYKIAAQQTSIFDTELAELEPSPFDFRFQFEDASGRHDYQNGDWETHVMFWRWRGSYGETSALEAGRGAHRFGLPDDVFEQIRIYDAYAGAFQVIHNNLDAALQAANVTGERGTLNAQAKSAARSAFESANPVEWFNRVKKGLPALSPNYAHHYGSRVRQRPP